MSKSDFGNQSKVVEDGVICVLSATLYFLDVTIGATNNVVMDSRFSLDTGAGFNIINKSALPPGWEHQFDKKVTPPTLKDENERPLELL